MALTVGGKVEKADYDAKKTDTTISLTTVDTNWTWTNTVSVGNLVTYNQMKELRDATDKAHNLINYGCNSHNSTVNTSHKIESGSGSGGPVKPQP